MKYFEPIYLVFLVVNIVKWLISAIDIFSQLAALAVGIMTVIYIYQKWKGQKLDNQLKKKELDE